MLQVLEIVMRKTGKGEVNSIVQMWKLFKTESGSSNRGSLLILKFKTNILFFRADIPNQLEKAGIE
jgi:hypothetical protein